MKLEPCGREACEQTIQALKQQVEILSNYIKTLESGHETMINYAQAQLEARTKRKWVGLTDEEIAEGAKQSWVDKQAFESAVWWAEAKLKEKNT